MKYTLQVHYVENSCILWVTDVGIRTFSMQNNYNLFYNPNPNIMMTYFYPRKHGMAEGNTFARSKPTRFLRNGPPPERPDGPGYITGPPGTLPVGFLS